MSQPVPQRVFLILGMHRSGTSSLAGTLQSAGLYLGDVHEKAPWNAKGNRESPVIMKLHEEVLRANGGGWDDPPVTVVWSPEHAMRRDHFISSRAGERLWGFKDPRTILTFGGWADALPHLKIAATLRHPLSVAASLMRRDGGVIERWVDLWVAYNERLLALHRARPFPIMDFDLPDEEYENQLSALIRALGMTERPGETRFFDASLRRFDPSVEERIPDVAKDLYEELRAISARWPA